MERKHANVLTIAALIAMGTGGVALAADKGAKTDLGKHEYENSCAFCHGKDGKSTGAINDLLKKAPADLTMLAKNNKGVFPFAYVYGVIDGREILRGHGDRDMPAWGARYSRDTVKAAEYYMDVPYDAEMYARSRILSLIDYLNRMQAK